MRGPFNDDPPSLNTITDCFDNWLAVKTITIHQLTFRPDDPTGRAGQYVDYTAPFAIL